MSDIKKGIDRIKQLLQEAEGIDLSNAHLASMPATRAYHQLKSESLQIIPYLITTIESQKEEIKQQSDALLETLDRVHDMESEINSLKAITELAVKKFEEIMRDRPMGSASFNIAVSAIKEIERLQNEPLG